jgi:hypothetical protein
MIGVKPFRIKHLFNEYFQFEDGKEPERFVPNEPANSPLRPTENDFDGVTNAQMYSKVIKRYCWLINRAQRFVRFPHVQNEREGYY